MARPPSELDVVELRVELSGWPSGTRGTVVSERKGSALVEMGTEGDADKHGLLGVMVEVPYAQLHVVAPASAEAA